MCATAPSADSNCGAPIGVKFNGSVLSSRRANEREARRSNPCFKVIQMAETLSNLRTDLWKASKESLHNQAIELLFP